MAANSRPIRILSIDGGGIRGIIPATVLAALESRAGQPICRLFDLIAGTSTGGILALGLVKPAPSGEPGYSAQQLIQLYEQDGAHIFSCPWWQRLPIISLIYSLFASRYSATHIDAVLHKYFGHSRLRDALTPLLIMSYELRKRDPWLFKSERAKAEPDHDFPMREVARATSAAPTYFPPLLLRDAPERRQYELIDGGVYANNPAMCAYVEAHTLFPDATDFIVVSLGTGQTSRPIHYRSARHWGIAGWARPILDVVFDGVSDTVDYQMQQLLSRASSPLSGTERGSGGEDLQRHFRFQAPLAPDQGAMDDASPGHLEQLKAVGQGIVTQHDRDLDELARRLTGR